MKLKKNVIVVLVVMLLFLYWMNMKKEHNIYGNVARNEEDIKKGLMWRKDKLRYNEGMLFPMTYQKNNMWMKNTYIPLDVIFLDPSMIIVGYVEDTVPLSTDNISIDKPSKYVLEMNSGSVRGHNMKIEDKIIFTEL